jgi:hypothetical protein
LPVVVDGTTTSSWSSSIPNLGLLHNLTSHDSSSAEAGHWS